MVHDPQKVAMIRALSFQAIGGAGMSCRISKQKKIKIYRYYLSYNCCEKAEVLTWSRLSSERGAVTTVSLFPFIGWEHC